MHIIAFTEFYVHLIVNMQNKTPICHLIEFSELPCEPYDKEIHVYVQKVHTTCPLEDVFIRFDTMSVYCDA